MSSGEAKKNVRSAHVKTSGASPSRQAGEALPPARRRIRLDRIIVADRLRSIDPATVDMLAVSMEEGELNTPLTVRPLRVDGDDMVFGLVTGGHRYAAAEKLGWTEIECSIRNLTDDQARMVEIDENLIRRGLSALDRAVFVSERLQVWAKLHPDRVSEAENVENISTLAPKRGRPSNADKMSEALGGLPPTMGFRHETAAELDISEKTVRNALLIARGLSLQTRVRVAGSKIAKNEGLLRQLAGVADKAEQLRIAEALVEEKAKSFPDALVIAQGREPKPPAPPRPVDETLKALEALWNKAPATHRAAMLHWLSGKPMPGNWAVVERADG